MRKLISLMLIISVCSLFSCTKDEEPADINEKDTTSVTPTPDKKEELHYYVKYELSAYYPVSANYYLSILFSDVKRASSVIFEERGKGKEWEGIYGPFKKGDHVILSCSGNLKMDISARISVSRNDEPFTVKVEKRVEAEKCRLEYTIDF